ncbi:hypothetical protein D3C77_438770 [compost metagenome]
MASIMPVCREVNTSLPGMITGVAPMLPITSPPRPGMRIFRPLRSSTLLISLLNQPPICMPELPPSSGLTPCGA